MSEPTLLKVTTEDYFRGKKLFKLYIFDAVALTQKRKSVPKETSISDQLKTLLPCLAIYFLGVNARFSQKLATENSSIGKTTLKIYNF